MHQMNAPKSYVKQRISIVCLTGDPTQIEMSVVNTYC